MKDDKPDYTLDSIIKQTLISRGASKEKYSLEVPTVQIDRPEESRLPIRQQDALSFLDISSKNIANYKQWENLGPDKIKDIIKNDINYERLWHDYINDISKAIQLGLIWDPLVSDFIYTCKAFGKKEILREIKRGIEVGVNRPITFINWKFKNHLDEIAELRIGGKTWTQIRRVLLKDKIIKNMSWQALKKKFEKAWEEKWRKVNKKAPLIP
jgi:hypothetical protein